MANEAFVMKIENAVKNRSARMGEFQLPVTYDEYLLTDGIDELLRRFKELLK